jgi:NTE family protein
MMTLSRRAIFIAAIILQIAIIHLIESRAQENYPPNAPDRRPRIGLALSGGGALGLAEIGVLQWMDENHIPVDRIAGTSIGSIIGAMYSTGMSPGDIEKFAEKINWAEAFLPEPTYTELSYRRKQDRRDFLIAAPLGLRHGLGGPNGFNSGQGVGLLLDRIAFPESGLESFDDLPIPFRCVATDMMTGQAVVLRDGSLAQAVRASMAIPGLFTPVEMNGRVLADGGMVQNIPVETLREMNADKIIAIELRLPPGEPGQLRTLTGVLTRAISVMITQNERHSLALATTSLVIDMTGFSVTDYSRVKEFVQLGYKTAASQSGALLPYAITDQAQWDAYLASRAARKHTAAKTIEKVAVTGADPATNDRLQQRLSRALRGPLDLKRLDRQLTRITGEGEFDRLGYEGFTQDGVPAIRITAHEKSYGPPFLDLAVNVDGAGVAAFDFSVGGRVTFTDVGHRGGEWRNDLMFGSSNLAATEFYQPVGDTRFFVATYAFASKLARNSFTGLTRVAVFGDERNGGGFDLGYAAGRRSEIRVGYQIFDGKLRPLIGATGLPIVEGITGQFRARYVWDGQDSPSVPSRGTRVVATLSRILQSPGLGHAVSQLDVHTSTLIATGSKTSLFFSEAGGTTIGGSAGPFQQFALGGPFRLGAYFPQAFIGNHYVYSALGFRRELFELPTLAGRKVYWGGWYEAGSVFGTPFDDPGPVVVRGTFNLGIIADTILGPVALAGSVSPTGQSRINFSMGKLF